jgi:hypothetical protein
LRLCKRDVREWVAGFLDCIKKSVVGEEAGGNISHEGGGFKGVDMAVRPIHNIDGPDGFFQGCEIIFIDFAETGGAPAVEKAAKDPAKLVNGVVGLYESRHNLL